MAEELRLWRIESDNSLQPVPRAPLAAESDVEEWLAGDISLLSPDLLVIGRQVQTDFGGFIDLLCMNSEGDLVVVELKRHQTPREVAAQVLDYASWVSDLSRERVEETANSYLGLSGPLERAFSERFGVDLPEVLNESHGMIVVAAQIDESTERIVRYLSETYGASINVARFQHFSDGKDVRLLARFFLVEPEVVQASARARGPSKRRHNLSFQELESIADANGVGHLYSLVTSAAKHLARQSTASSMAFKADIAGSRKVVLSLIPTKSSSSAGLYFQIYERRACAALGISPEELRKALPKDHSHWKYSPNSDDEMTGWDGHIRDEHEARAIAGLFAR